MFIDNAKVTIKSGDGGSGCVSFHREKYMPKGGPDGGDGGNGGSIIFVADTNMRTLLDFHFQRHYKAQNGESGFNNMKKGKEGKDMIINVPRGTIIKDAQSGQVIADMFEENCRKVILRGGKGGKGNARFTTPTRQSPNFSQQGELTKEREILLELKTIADVGLVGFPNVGKSTILSVVSKARPKIANYHFTTLEPNLGVVSVDGSSFVMADIPGLIEGAAQGAGLGHDFLRHIERTRVIIHVLDIAGSEGRDPLEDYRIINKELAEYSAVLAECPQLIAANKSELPGTEENLRRLQETVKDCPIFVVSAATNQGFTPLLRAAEELLKTLPPPEPIEGVEELFYVTTEESFEILKLSGDLFIVKGTMIDHLMRNVSIDDPDSFQYFQRMLRERGIIDALRAKGAAEGATVRIDELEFDFVD